MPDASRVLLQRLQAAFDTVRPGADPVLRASDRADFQANGALPLGKEVGRPPRQVAEEVVAAADLDDICTVVEVSGPGFINLTLSDEFVAGQVAAMSADPRLGVPVTPHPERVVIDYSAPNVAKEMHVGHLRTTIIGDALARLLDFLGHDVRRENHIGDWGTPFGMLIEYLLDVDGAERAESFSVRDLNEFYAAARRQFDADPVFAERSRRRVVLLQNGDPETMRLWRIFVAESMRHAQEVYDLLGVLLTPEDVLGESFYNPLLPVVVTELGEEGLLVENDGALCVFPDGFENRNGEPLPLIVRKSDGGYGYPATDLASVRDRTERVGASRLLYVVGVEQSLHLRLVFAVAALAGYLPDAAAAVHVALGHVLGTDGKKLASRDGGSERLVDLLHEGIDRAASALKERAQRLVARAAGRGRPGARHRRRQVRRPVHRAPAGLRLRLGSHARLRGQHRALPAVCARADSFHLPARRDGTAGSGSGAAPRRAAGARARPPTVALRRGGRGRGGDVQPVEAVRLPLRPGHLVHRVLRGVPRARGR